jgi:hypothetical protein
MKSASKRTKVAVSAVQSHLASREPQSEQPSGKPSLAISVQAAGVKALWVNRIIFHTSGSHGKYAFPWEFPGQELARVQLSPAFMARVTVSFLAQLSRTSSERLVELRAPRKLPDSSATDCICVVPESSLEHEV